MESKLPADQDRLQPRQMLTPIRIDQMSALTESMASEPVQQLKELGNIMGNNGILEYIRVVTIEIKG